MNGISPDVFTFVRCEGMNQMLVMYHDTGITLYHGHRDEEHMFVIEGREDIYFADSPELVELYFDSAWDAQGLAALAQKSCLEGSKDDAETKKTAT